ncbi:MAG: DUF1565 domain-containing protein [Anaerolineae bacterium]|nr:DUF1565 domain-containing protein [Anaerolineae bacterium]
MAEGGMGFANFRLSFASLLVLGLILGPWAPLSVVDTAPATLFVKADAAGGDCTQSQPCTLAAALATATGGDTIYVAEGTYVGAGDQAVVTLAKSLTLYGGWDGSPTGPPVRDPSARPTILDGEGARRVVQVTAGTSTLEGFTITRGYSSSSGGGIYAIEAGINLRGNRITDNVSGHDGGALFISRGSAQIVGNDISGNSATWAAGLRLINDVDVSVIGNRIHDNQATISGGAMEIACCGRVTAFIAANVISDNDGGSLGGGVLVESTSATLQNNILARNQATRGSNVYAEGSTEFPASVAMTNNTLVGSGAGSEGIWVDAYVTAVLVNNLITGHGVGMPIPAAGSAVTAEHNLFWNAEDPYTGIAPVLADPRLDPAHHLTADSPARDAGKAVGLATDIDGDSRPFSGSYDIGADEYVEDVAKSYLPLVTKRTAVEGSQP